MRQVKLGVIPTEHGEEVACALRDFGPDRWRLDVDWQDGTRETTPELSAEELVERLEAEGMDIGLFDKRLSMRAGGMWRRFRASLQGGVMGYSVEVIVQETMGGVVGQRLQ